MPENLARAAGPEVGDMGDLRHRDGPTESGVRVASASFYAPRPWVSVADNVGARRATQAPEQTSC